jgi:phosphate transport system protein
MASQHIVKSYEEELRSLEATILRMGGLAEGQLNAAIEAFAKRDTELAIRTAAADKQIDQIDHEIAEQTTRLLALRQPMADDLRQAIGALMLAGEIERIGDHAKNIAKHFLVVTRMPAPRSTTLIQRMGELVQHMIKDVLDAYSGKDPARAIAVWKRDGEVDELYNTQFRAILTYMLEDSRTITACTHLLFIAKNIERIGDHATNMAETIHFVLTGKRLDDEVRPRGEDASTIELPSTGHAAGE